MRDRQAGIQTDRQTEVERDKWPMQQYAISSSWQLTRMVNYAAYIESRCVGFADDISWTMYVAQETPLLQQLLPQQQLPHFITCNHWRQTKKRVWQPNRVTVTILWTKTESKWQPNWRGQRLRSEYIQSLMYYYLRLIQTIPQSLLDAQSFCRGA